MILLKKVIRKIYRNHFKNRIQLGNFNLNIGKAHNLPYVLEEYPEYGTNIVRIAKNLYKKDGELSIIDIGANIGDTIATLLTDIPESSIVAIEGDSYFYSILKSNFSQNKHVSLYQYFLGESDTVIDSNVKRNGSTLRIEKGAHNKKIELTTLDTFLNTFPQHKKSKLLKIDTDGYDNRILRGSKQFLTSSQPVVFFEYDVNLLAKNNEAGLDIFDFLKNCGYETVLFYDNFGRLLISTLVGDTKTINQLHRYCKDNKGAFAFFDIMAFHATDNKLAELFILSEENNP